MYIFIYKYTVYISMCMLAVSSINYVNPLIVAIIAAIN